MSREILYMSACTVMSLGSLNFGTAETRRKVAVIGGGVAGLTAAVRLAHAGAEVVVLEKNERVGGRLGLHQAEGFTWDTGPTLLTMPHVLRDLWTSVGRELEDYLELISLDLTCRHRWEDGMLIDQDRDLWRRSDVDRFVRYARGIYEIASDVISQNPIEDWHIRIRPRNFFELRHLPKVATPKTMHRIVRRHFRRDRHMVQLFDRYATWTGSSPFKTPALFNLIPYVECAFGSWYVKGGLHGIATALARLATELGARIVTRAEVTAFRRLPGGYALDSRAGYCAAPAVVCNQDALTAASTYLGMEHQVQLEKTLKKRQLSASAFVMLLGVKRRYDGLAHHNVFHSRDHRKEFRQLFRNGIPPDEPTISVSVDAVTEPARAPEGCDNWTIRTVVPPVNDRFDWEIQADVVVEQIHDRLAAFGFEDLREQIVTRRSITPLDFEKEQLAFRGSLHGFAAHGRRSALRRPPMELRDLPGIYFVGATTHPGGGIPLDVLAGQVAARKILERLAS